MRPCDACGGLAVAVKRFRQGSRDGVDVIGTVALCGDCDAQPASAELGVVKVVKRMRELAELAR